MFYCNKCECHKDASAFYASCKSQCKECVKARVRAHRVGNIERIRDYDRRRGQWLTRKQANAKRRPRYKEKHKEWSRAYRIANAEKRAAHVIVGNAMRDGKLEVRPCERCGYGTGIHAHHEDYSRQLDVMWLCPPCHGERHREINEERRQAG